MLTLLRNGGYVPMLFILLTGLVGLGAAFHFALRARKETFAFVKWMALTTVLGTLAATCADVGATLYTAEKSFEDKEHPVAPAPGPPRPAAGEAAGLPNALHIVVAGLAESTSPGILGFSLVALTTMLTAVGRRRLAEREAATAASSSV